MTAALLHFEDFRFHGPEDDIRAFVGSMAKRDETTKLSWPWWAPWALLAVALTSLLTIAATLYDIR
jgi:hypothetical protein